MSILTFAEKNINTAIQVLKNGNLVAIPTETVYGLAGNAYNGEAVAKIFEAKKRPFLNPLIVHFSNFAEIEKNCIITKSAYILQKQFMPGPLTLILPKRNNSKISPLCNNGSNYQAVRIPKGKLFLTIASRLDFPLAMPSANPYQSLSPTTAKHVANGLNNKIPILQKDDDIELGIESTIVDSRHDDFVTILRSGNITAQEISQYVPIKPVEGDIKSSGQDKKHYAPKKKIILNQTSAKEEQGFIDFGAGHKKSKHYFNLSKKGNLQEAASNLFKALWFFDEQNVSEIVVAPIPEEGIGIAINDRIKRASYDG